MPRALPRAAGRLSGAHPAPLPSPSCPDPAPGSADRTRRRGSGGSCPPARPGRGDSSGARRDQGGCASQTFQMAFPSWEKQKNPTADPLCAGPPLPPPPEEAFPIAKKDRRGPETLQYLPLLFFLSFFWRTYSVSRTLSSDIATFKERLPFLRSVCHRSGDTSPPGLWAGGGRGSPPPPGHLRCWWLSQDVLISSQIKTSLGFRSVPQMT